MVQASCLVALHELRTQQPPPGQQLHLLRLLKNDIVGHGQRKQAVVTHGLLDCLYDILRSSPPHDVQLQAVLIIGSLAEQGPQFVAPIVASNLIQPLLLSLPPQHTSARLITASLRALNALVASCRLSPHSNSSFVQHVLNKTSARSFLHILRQPLPTTHQNLHISLATALIADCCNQCPPLRPVLAKAGLLDALASLLAGYALAHNRNARSHHAQLDVVALLDALSAITADSPYRTHRLIFSPDLRRIFSDSPEDSSLESIHIPNFNQHRHTAANTLPVDTLLPKVMAPLQKSVSFGSQAYPAFASSKIFSDHSVGYVSVSSPLCAWLMYISRSRQDPCCRLAALRLLAIVNEALDAGVGASRPDLATKSREREKQIALFAIPIAVKLVQDALDTSEHVATVIKEEACSVLAHLIQNSPDLQKAALDAGAVKHVSQLFRKSFDPVVLGRPMWSANPQALEPDVSPTPSTTLGDEGLPQEVMHAMKCRAGALDALAAIAEKEDPIRKAVIDSGIVPNLIDSLGPLSVFDPSSVPAKNGNTVPVLLAACRAATAMSRSVSLLRTSLIDAGIAKPVFALLRHPDLAVQIAATNATCNLVLDFSPMRQDLINAGVVRTLCEHAKHSDSKLRQASLWALKHLVLNAPQSMKHSCLDELGTGWLVQAVNGGPQSGAPLAMGTPNAAGEQVDLLNTPETSGVDMDLTEQDDEEDDNDEFMFDQNGTRYQSSGLRSTLDTANFKARLRLLRENEQNPAIQAKHDDMLVQEQALDFIRNLVNGDDNVAMIDYLNDVLGTERIFDMLYTKLKPVSGSAHGTQRQLPLSPQIQQSGAGWQPPEIINAALGVIVHLAGGSAKHRQQLIAQKALLNAWLPHFSHHDRRIRVASVWAVINLTWVENASDRDDAKQRALELRAIGIDEKVRGLANDSDLDTRERVKTALRQIDELLEGGRYR